MQLILDSVRDATQVVINGRDWCSAFARNGFGCQQEAVRPQIRKALALDEHFKVPSHRPLPVQVRLCLPRNAKIFYCAIWRSLHLEPHVPKAIPALAGAAASESSSASSHGSIVPKATPALAGAAAGESSSASSHGPIASRTRAKSKAAPTVGCFCGFRWKLLCLLVGTGFVVVVSPRACLSMAG